MINYTLLTISNLQKSMMLVCFGGQRQDQHPAFDHASLLESIDCSLLLTDEAGPPLSEKLARVLNSKFQAEFDRGNRKELLSKYKVPRNCESFYVSKVNPEIRQKLSVHANIVI